MSSVRGGRQGGSQSVVTHPALTGRADFAGVAGLTVGGSFFTGDSWQGLQTGTPRMTARTTLIEGHARWNWRGEGYGEDAPQWSENLRKPSGPVGSTTGLDARAVEIERRLGVR